MDLNEIKSKAYSKGLLMKDIPLKLGVSKQYFYRMLKKKDKKFIEKLKCFFK